MITDGQKEPKPDVRASTEVQICEGIKTFVVPVFSKLQRILDVPEADGNGRSESDVD
jgi:hypothetical protein